MDGLRVVRRDGLAEQAVAARRRIHHGGAARFQPVQGLNEQPLGRRLDDVNAIEARLLAVRRIDPLGRAGLRVGIDQRNDIAAGSPRAAR